MTTRQITLQETSPGNFQVLAPSQPATGGGTGNPFDGSSPSTALAPSGSSTGWPARLPNGQVIIFASEADYLKAENWVRSTMAQTPSASQLGGTTPMLGGGSTGQWLRTGAEAADTVVGFLQGRALDRKIDDFNDALTRLDRAETQLEALRATHPDIIPPILEFLRAERDATITAQEVLEDEISAVDIRTGAGVAKVVSQFMTPSTSTSGVGTAVAIGGVGLGLGLLVSRDDRGRRRRR